MATECMLVGKLDHGKENTFTYIRKTLNPPSCLLTIGNIHCIL